MSYSIYKNPEEYKRMMKERKRQQFLQKLKSILLCVVVVGALCFALIDFDKIGDSFYQGQFPSKMDLDNAAGDKIITYYVEEEDYSRDFVPSTYLAQSESEIGAVLEIRYEEAVYQHYGYSGNTYLSAEPIHVTLIDCDTGTVIFENTYYPNFPKKSNGSIKYDEDRIVSDVESQWAAYLANNS